MAKKITTKQGRQKKPRRSDYMSVQEARLYLAEWAANHNAALAGVGSLVAGGNPKGRPLTITDDDLATRWLAARQDWGWTRAGVSLAVSEALAREGITLSADRITKRVRAYLQPRGKWT